MSQQPLSLNGFESSDNTDVLPEGYRMTELGPLPKEWRVVRLREVVEEIQSGDWGNPDREKGSIECYVIRGTDFPLAEQGIFNGVPVRYIKGSSAKKRICREGDLLIELSGGSEKQPTGRIMLVTERVTRREKPVVFSNFVKRIRVNEEMVIPLYFRIFWQLRYDQGATRIYEKRTTGIRNFKLDDFLQKEPIPLPPLPEQRAIAHVLRAVQQAKEATEQVIQATRELKKSLMRHLFTYGPVPVDAADRVEIQETAIGPIPTHWRVVRLGDVAKTTSGGTPKRDNPEYYGGQIPWIKSGELNDGEIYFSTEHITEAGLRNSNARVFPPGTLLMAMYGATAGKVGILQIPAATNQAICAILPKEPKVFFERFLFYALIYLRSMLLAQRYGGAQPNLSQTVIQSFHIPLPPLSEQQEIARILQAVDEKIRAEEARKEALEALFKSLLHNLMTAKIRLPVDFIAQFSEQANHEGE